MVALFTLVLFSSQAVLESSFCCMLLDLCCKNNHILLRNICTVTSHNLASVKSRSQSLQLLFFQYLFNCFGVIPTIQNKCKQYSGFRWVDIFYEIDLTLFF